MFNPQERGGTGHSSEGPYGTRGLLRHGNKLGDPSNAPRCGATTRRGTVCQAPAMRNARGIHTRCRVHGGASTGPRTPAGIERCRKARWKHGKRSAVAIQERREFRQQVRARDRFLRWLSTGADEHLALTQSLLFRIDGGDSRRLVPDCRWLRLDDEQNRVIAFMEDTHGEIRQSRDARRMERAVRELFELGAAGTAVEDLRVLFVNAARNRRRVPINQELRHATVGAS